MIRILKLYITIVLAILSKTASATWTITDGTLQLGSSEEPLLTGSSLEPLASLSSAQPKAKISFTTLKNGKPEKPHQVFLRLRDDITSLETFIVGTAKNDGKVKLEISYDTLPSALIASKELDIRIILGSFGKVPGSEVELGTLILERSNFTEPKSPRRFKALPEIIHIFKPSQTHLNKTIASAFSVVPLVLLAGLITFWVGLGANLKQLPSAFKARPLSYVTFFASIILFQVIFLAFYIGVSVFYILGASALTGSIAVLSGSRALRDVKLRREAGKF